MWLVECKFNAKIHWKCCDGTILTSRSFGRSQVTLAAVLNHGEE